MINTQHFDELGSASWVDELRQRAAKRLDDLSPPDPRAEQWRLSKKARADTNPQLEIQTDDVRCTHGATCGPLQQEQLFYLMSRGIPETEARRLVVQGFFQSVIQQLDWSGMETALGQAVQQKLSAIR